MSLPKTKLTGYTYAPETKLKGRVVPGSESVFDFWASVQPETSQAVTKLLPSGRENSYRVKLLTKHELFLADERAGRNCDQVLIGGKRFDIMIKSPWKNRVINHYEYVAVEVE